MSSLLLIGCGNMGSALLTRWCETLPGDFSKFYVVDPHAPKIEKSITHAKQISELPKDCNPTIIILAVKPNQLDEVMSELFARFANAPTYLSIAAGKNLSFYENHLSTKTSIVRAMPNTPAMIGEGMTALVGNAALTYEGRTFATQLMSAVGDTLWIDDEAMMDVVTAISGSGPAYFFYFMECLQEAAIQNGLSRQAAETLVYKTATGSALLARESDEELALLRKRVTSPGGTTEAALSKLLGDDSLKKIMASAVEAAINRAKTMA